jgi:putative colanic acid biosynthesis acetyltransferase WcaF
MDQVKVNMVNQDTHSGPSFSLKNRLARVGWGLASILFFRYSPRPLHAWRSLLLRRFGASIGKGVHIYPAVKIWAPWNLKVGDESGIGDRAIVYNQGQITIGTRVVISQGVHLCAGTHDYTKAGFPLVTKPITIGNQVWIAAETFIHPGVTIGDGAVIGARSVVTKSMPAWKVCTGHPCQPLKDRVIENN